MILTVTLNPLLERRITCSSINIGLVNREGKIEIKSGGKGINVSRQLNNLGIDNLAFTFSGGSTGREFKDIVHREGIKSVFVHTEANTREALIFINESARLVTSCFSMNSCITQKEAYEFSQRLVKMIPNYEMIVLSGSSPCKETNSIFPEAISCAIKNDRIIICDTYGEHLGECLEASPTIVHNNIDEIENSLNIKLRNNDDINNLLSSLYSKNIKQVYLTDAGNPFFASNFDYRFRINPPAVKTVDSTGSGDAFTAGIIYGWHNDLVFEETLKTAVALGAANASFFDVCNVKINGFEELKTSVIITPIGKKMKVIDVKPQ
ncbi:MAG: PfkB family carbohydrate kinase [Ignavibacteriaceae bacterium]|nr:PfkB family carbohydrate kinase [Ignavibacteriaceae bacterium]